MITVSITNFRKRLFEYLDRVAAGETIIIQRNNIEVARLTGMSQLDWREKMPDVPRLLVEPEALLQPLTDIWEEYV
jgi:prevent-host-death family protein